MFYGSHGLHGRSRDQSSFLMIPEDERYDYAHFEFVMRGVQAAREQFPDIADQISLSLHCETAEIMTAYTKLVEEDGTLTGLAAYSASRPPHSEGLAVTIASYLAHETGLPTINLLHLTSRKAIEAAMLMARTFPHIDFRREVTIGHLLADIDTASGIGGKVNPPLRPREDVEALWEHLLAGEIDWVVSDHACCRDEHEVRRPARRRVPRQVRLRRRRVPAARPGQRGPQAGPVATTASPQLTAWNPAQRFGLRTKGAIADGLRRRHRAGRPDRTWTVRAEDSESTQEYTPFEGFELTAKVTDTFLRGEQIMTEGVVTSAARPAGTSPGQPRKRHHR